MKNITKLAIAFGLGMLLMFIIFPRKVEKVPVPVTVEVEVPSKSNDFKPIEDPKPIPVSENKIVVDSSLVEQYKKANDSLKQVLYKQSVTKREYEETFEDSVQTIKVKAKVTGTLNSLSASYITKPFKQKVDTILQVEVPKRKRSITLYGELGVSTKLSTAVEQNTAIFKAGVDIKNRKGFILGASFDTNKTGWLKIGKSFDF